MAEESKASRELWDAAVACFDDCQGMVLNSIEESDRYWEFADQAMRILGAAIGEAPLRKVPTND